MVQYEAGHCSGLNSVLALSRWRALGRRAASTERRLLPSGVSDPCGMHELLAAGCNAARGSSGGMAGLSCAVASPDNFWARGSDGSRLLGDADWPRCGSLSDFEKGRQEGRYDAALSLQHRPSLANNYRILSKYTVIVLSLLYHRRHHFLAAELRVAPPCSTSARVAF